MEPREKGRMLRFWRSGSVLLLALGVAGAGAADEHPKPPLEPLDPGKPLEPLAPARGISEPGSGGGVSTGPKPGHPEPSAVDPTTKPGWQVPAEEGVKNVPPAKAPREGSARAEVGQPAVSPQLAAALEKAKRNEKRYRKHPEERIKLYRKVVAAEPGNAEARYRLGLALAKGSNWKAAAEELEKVLVVAPNRPRYLADYSTVAMRAGQYRKALAASLKATQLRPGSARYYNALGNIYLMLGDNPSAAKVYRVALQLKPDHPRYMHNLARAYLQGGRPKMAVEILTEVLHLDKHSSQAYNDRATAHQRMKEYKQAISDYRSALQFNPDYAPAHYNLSQLYLDDSDPTYTYRFKALAHAQSAVRLTREKDPAYLMGLAAAYRANQEFKKAIAAARKAVNLDPSDANRKQLTKYQQLDENGYPGRLPDLNQPKKR